MTPADATLPGVPIELGNRAHSGIAIIAIERKNHYRDQHRARCAVVIHAGEV